MRHLDPGVRMPAPPRTLLIAALLAVAGSARAEAPQSPPPPATAPPAPNAAPPSTAPPAPAPLSPAEEEALKKALESEAAARNAKAAPAAPAPPTGPSTNPLVRAFQSLNPDISAIVDFAAGWYSD